jgi:hypothetical protein
LFNLPVYPNRQSFFGFDIFRLYNVLNLSIRFCNRRSSSWSVISLCLLTVLCLVRMYVSRSCEHTIVSCVQIRSDFVFFYGNRKSPLLSFFFFFQYRCCAYAVIVGIDSILVLLSVSSRSLFWKFFVNICFSFGSLLLRSYSSYSCFLFNSRLNSRILFVVERLVCSILVMCAVVFGSSIRNGMYCDRQFVFITIVLRELTIYTALVNLNRCRGGLTYLFGSLGVS